MATTVAATDATPLHLHSVAHVTGDVCVHLSPFNAYHVEWESGCFLVVKHASRHAVVLRSEHSPPHPLSTTVRRWRGAQHEVAAMQLHKP